MDSAPTLAFVEDAPQSAAPAIEERKPAQNGKGVQWTDAMLAQLRELHGSGLSAREIAERIGGVSRNGVIGKLNRLRMSKPTPSSIARKLKRETAIAGREAAGLPTRGQPTGAKAATAALQPTQCRWPVNHPDEPHFHYCMALKPFGQPYCEAHRAVARSPVQPAWPKKRGRAA